MLTTSPFFRSIAPKSFGAEQYCCEPRALALRGDVLEMGSSWIFVVYLVNISEVMI
jgi:hypothetical protein